MRVVYISDRVRGTIYISDLQLRMESPTPVSSEAMLIELHRMEAEKVQTLPRLKRSEPWQRQGKRKGKRPA